MFEVPHKILGRPHGAGNRIHRTFRYILAGSLLTTKAPNKSIESDSSHASDWPRSSVSRLQTERAHRRVFSCVKACETLPNV